MFKIWNPVLKSDWRQENRMKIRYFINTIVISSTRHSRSFKIYHGERKIALTNNKKRKKTHTQLCLFWQSIQIEWHLDNPVGNMSSASEPMCIANIDIFKNQVKMQMHCSVLNFKLITILFRWHKWYLDMVQTHSGDVIFYSNPNGFITKFWL